MSAFVASYALLTTAFVPRGVMNLLAGMVYGTLLGVGLAVTASMLGAWLAFVLGATLFSGLLRAGAEHSRLWQAVDQVVHRRPILFTTLWHLSLVLPFSAINYYMGASRVRLRDFLCGKAIGVLPATFAYVYVGTLIPDVLLLASGELPDAAERTRLWIGAAGVTMTLVLVIWMGRAAHRTLRELSIKDEESV